MNKNHKHWKDIRDEEISVMRKDNVRGLTKNQDIYINAINNSVITFCTGPAGSGKSYVACGMAAKYLKDGKVEKIVVSRPLVNCGKGIGFLPGELQEKVDPYMRPIFDAFYDFFTPEEIDKYIKEGLIEMVPLELMRGSSIKKAFILLDEAQNCEYIQLHMFLTRFGEGSKVVITGDASQSDLIGDTNTFANIVERFRSKRHKDISIIELERKDIVRHPLIAFVDEQLTTTYGETNVAFGTWYSIYCPNCDKIVWYNNGDENDLTMPDIEIVRCWHCREYMDIDGDKVKGHAGKIYEEGHRRPE